MTSSWVHNAMFVLSGEDVGFMLQFLCWTTFVIFYWEDWFVNRFTCFHSKAGYFYDQSTNFLWLFHVFLLLVLFHVRHSVFENGARISIHSCSLLRARYSQNCFLTNKPLHIQLSQPLLHQCSLSQPFLPIMMHYGVYFFWLRFTQADIADKRHTAAQILFGPKALQWCPCIHNAALLNIRVRVGVKGMGNGYRVNV